MKIHAAVMLLMATMRTYGMDSIGVENGPSPRFLAALVRVESAGNIYAIGDRKLRHQAYGPLQIRQPVCDDLNRRYQTRYVARDCLGNLSLSKEICRRYLKMYASRESLRRLPTDRDYARIWNGGPKGAKNPQTLVYWDKVQKELARGECKTLPEIAGK